jgi:phage recombination protein Bet
VTTDTSALVASPVDPDISAAMVLFDRMKPLQDALGVKDLSDGEMQVFAMVCHHTGLDPFTRQIYALKRGGKVTHQTGIDGYRSSAERTKQYRGTDEATFEECGCGDKDSPPEHPKLARVVVYRAYPDGIRPQIGVARWHELKPPHTKSQNAYDYRDSMWWQQPYNQLAKCAEAAGLRKAFPRVFGGVYITEEMQQADVIEGESERVVAPTAKERIAARRAAARQPVVSATGGNADAPNDGPAPDVEEAVWSPAPEQAVPSMSAEEFDRLAHAKHGLTTAMVQTAHDELMPGVKGADMTPEMWFALAMELGLIEGAAA